jgi:splicing suppressor protein 51
MVVAQCVVGGRSLDLHVHFNFSSIYDSIYNSNKQHLFLSAIFGQAMSSKYTCQRCLGALKSTRRPSAKSLWPIASRFSSSSSSATGLSRPSNPTNPTPKRHVSTFGSQPQQPVADDGFQIPGKAPSFKRKPDGTTDLSRVVLGQDQLFHPMSQSPIPAMRQRAAFIKAHAYCPHPSHNRTRIVNSEEDSEARKPAEGGQPPAHVKFECPYCGVPAFCSEEHWEEDFEEHLKLCDTLKEINEDEHDLRSGRHFSEFDFPERYMEEAVPNFTNWDTLLYTRGFEAINENRRMRHATRLLTYPMTIASILHEYSPYTLRGESKMTAEGLRSFSGKNIFAPPPPQHQHSIKSP